MAVTPICPLRRRSHYFLVRQSIAFAQVLFSTILQSNSATDFTLKITSTEFFRNNLWSTPYEERISTLRNSKP